ncbi:MAG: hypothetical protein GY778_16405 [bacterium]|nr:hypothetical protein [bacterium]
MRTSVLQPIDPKRRQRLAGCPAVVLVGGVLLTGLWCSAAEGSASDADAILDKFVEATGGRAAYARIHNRVSTERLVHVGMGFEDSIVTYWARPNQRYTTITSEATGTVRQGTDGDVVWRLADQCGPIVEEGEARESRLIAAAFDRAVNWRKYYKKVELADEAEIDGRPCDKVVLTPNVGPPDTHYYDRQSHLLVKALKPMVSSRMPTIVFEVGLSDYKEVDGLLIPHEMRQSFEMCGSKREMIIIAEKIEHNVDLPSDRFDPPEEIRQLTAMSGSASWGEALRKSIFGSGSGKSKGRCGGGKSSGGSASSGD